ncbi:hypothetical protein DQT32_03410 [Salmonella enterica subsp. enterica serovar Braenderup]|nr:hypothetical protein [Salmonella enterica subsp. enterica serovar Braenderup]
MKVFSELHNMKADEFEFKFCEYYKPWDSENHKLNYSSTVYLKDLDIGLSLSENSSSVHYMSKVQDDGRSRNSVHVEFRTNEDEYSLTVFKMNLTGDENDFIQDYDAVNDIPEDVLRRCNLDMETLTQMANLAVDVVEILKKDETIIKNVL